MNEQSPVCEANSPEILHLRSQVAKLKQALKPFAQITPSSFFPYDGSEAEGYIVMLKGDWGNPIEFTGADIAAARAALTEEDKEND